MDTRNACRRYPTVNPSIYDDTPRSAENAWRAIALGFLAGLLWLLWQATRLSVLALLMILEPIVSAILAAAALLGTLTAVFWKLASDRADFPFFGVLALSLGCFFLLTLYHAAIRLLSGVTNGRRGGGAHLFPPGGATAVDAHAEKQ